MKIKPAPYQPDVAIPPGETLIEMMEDKGISRSDSLNKIIDGEPINAEMAIELEHLLGLPANFWLNLESNYRLAKSRLEQDQGNKR